MSTPGFVASNTVAPSLRNSSFAGSNFTDKERSCVCPGQTLKNAQARPTRRARMPQMQLSSPSIQVGRPKTSIKKNIGVVNPQSQEPETETGRGAAKARPKRKTQADEIPMYKLILLGDEEYVQAHVVTQLQKIVGLEKKRATKCFHEAQQTGSSIATVVCQEMAEFFMQQLQRQELYVTIEKDE